MATSGKNLYLKLINLVTIALNHSDTLFQEKLLSSCIEIVQQVKTSEKDFLNKCVDDTHYVMSSLFYKNLSKKSEETVFDKLLFDSSLEEPRKVPRDPILIGKTSKSITFRIPVFNPKVSVKLLLEDPSKQFLGKIDDIISVSIRKYIIV